MAETRRPPENAREKPRGHNTEVRFMFVRHSQKSSGEVVNRAVTGMSVSDLSEGGKERARKLGERILTGRQPRKGYATSFDRTRETLEEALKGAGIDLKILQEGKPNYQSYFALPEARRSPAFLKKYKAAMDVPKDAYMAEHYPGRRFEELSPDEQEEVMEYANEFAVEMYLQYGNQRPDSQTQSPRELAVEVAYKINRLITLPDHMPDGNSVDLVSAGHKTSTEAFLMYVILRQVDGRTVIGFQGLAEIGGSLKILDSWDLLVRNDATGEKTISITLNRESGEVQTFGVDLETLRTLVRDRKQL